MQHLEDCVVTKTYFLIYVKSMFCPLQADRRITIYLECLHF